MEQACQQVKAGAYFVEDVRNQMYCKALRFFDDFHGQVKSRESAGCKQAENPGMHVRTGEKQVKVFS